MFLKCVCGWARAVRDCFQVIIVTGIKPKLNAQLDIVK